MEWFTFLIYLLIAVCCSLVVWFTIKVGFRVSTLSDSVSSEAEELSFSDAGSSDQTPHLYWNFTAILIVVPTLLLVLGISMQTTPLKHPVTGTLAVALVLIWVMLLWSGMLSIPSLISNEHKTEPPLLPDSVTTEFTISPTKTETRETP